MLVAKRSAGVTPKVNLRTLLHACNESHKNAKGSILALNFNTEGRHRQKSKTGVSVASQKGLVSSKKIYKSF